MSAVNVPEQVTRAQVIEAVKALGLDPATLLDLSIGGDHVDFTVRQGYATDLHVSVRIDGVHERATRANGDIR